MSGLQLADRVVNRFWVRHVTVGEVVFDRLNIEPAREVRRAEQRLQLGAEEQTPVRQQCVVQGLDPQAVAREEEGLAPAVPQRKSEHSPEALDAIWAPLF